MKNSNVLSANQSWVDSAKKSDNNQMKVKGQTIHFRTTFKVETIEVLYKLLNMKKGHWILFKEEEARVLNNALLKFQREYALSHYQFSVFKKGFKKGRVMVGRTK